MNKTELISGLRYLSALMVGDYTISQEKKSELFCVVDEAVAIINGTR